MTYAGFWKRVVAIVIDSVITLLAGVVVGGLLMIAAKSQHPEQVKQLGNIVGIILTWFYFAVMESSTGQGTIGKKAVGIKVTDLEGNRITFGKASGRFFAKFLSGLLLMAGYFMAGFTQKKQALHDMVAGCLVVNR